LISIFILLLCVKCLELLEIVVLYRVYVDLTCLLNDIFFLTLVKFQGYIFYLVLFIFLVWLWLYLSDVFIFFLNFSSLCFYYDVRHILKFLDLILLVILLNWISFIQIYFFLLILKLTNIINLIFIHKIVRMGSQKGLLGSRRSHRATLLKISEIRLQSVVLIVFLNDNVIIFIGRDILMIYLVFISFIIYWNLNIVIKVLVFSSLVLAFVHCLNVVEVVLFPFNWRFAPIPWVVTLARPTESWIVWEL
jgi:hypothetical protein